MFENNPGEDTNNTPAPLKEGVDFYFENGLMVLTKHYLKELGYCCGNRCRHCPYGHTNVPDHKR